MSTGEKGLPASSWQTWNVRGQSDASGGHSSGVSEPPHLPTSGNCSSLSRCAARLRAGGRRQIQRAERWRRAPGTGSSARHPSKYRSLISWESVVLFTVLLAGSYFIFCNWTQGA